ncbi:hypothetical protein SCH4B_0461 [Ruegeria sp. TrichCH4B]|nr:hypothetical protein SCH4B_0461 [Ruegeria sp. TrichCH4B]
MRCVVGHHAVLSVQSHVGLPWSRSVGAVVLQRRIAPVSPKEYERKGNKATPIDHCL